MNTIMAQGGLPGLGLKLGIIPGTGNQYIGPFIRLNQVLSQHSHLKRAINMIRFWFKLEFDDTQAVPYGTRMGCGITAHNYDDAIKILNEKVFKGSSEPNIIECVENVDISSLDQGHVIPNMAPPNFRGVWFPLGYQ